MCITSPTYYGVLSDIPAIAAVCHAHGAKLMVDGAHGAGPQLPHQPDRFPVSGRPLPLHVIPHGVQRRHEHVGRGRAAVHRAPPLKLGQGKAVGKQQGGLSRLTLTSPDGFALADALRERGIYPELADRGHVVCICTCADGPQELARLEEGLEGTGGLGPPASRKPPVVASRVDENPFLDRFWVTALASS